MKAKWIRLAIGRKIDEWIESIEDVPLRKLVKKNVIVTGGCIVSMLQNEKVNDFDVYLRTEECAYELARYYVAKFKANPPQRFKDSPDSMVPIEVQKCNGRVKIVVQSSGIAGESGSEGYQYFEQVQGDEDQASFVEQVVADAAEAVQPSKEAKYRPVFLSANCITLSHETQVVIRFWGEPEQIHSTYDFVHCTCYWDSKDRQLHLPPEALESILTHDLRYMGQSKYPICAMIRVRKFLCRGWNITAGQLLKIAWDISKLDLTNYVVLEDQLIGVDAAYFYQVLVLLRQRDPDKIDGAYLMEVIDKIF
jgi:hypothetical protein